MNTDHETTREEAEIRQLIEDRAEAVRTRDVDGTMANVAPDVLLFDIVNPLQSTGSNAARTRLDEWLSSFQKGPIGYDVLDVSVTASDNVAFCHCLNQVRATKLDGGEIEMRWRVTTCYRKVDGTWTVTHEHASVPFDVETGLASLDLKP